MIDNKMEKAQSIGPVPGTAYIPLQGQLNIISQKHPYSQLYQGLIVTGWNLPPTKIEEKQAG